jgi:aldose 1-epimerase
LEIEYEAISDKDTIVNLTNHSYFNLNGHNSGNILEHILRINATEIAKNDEEFIPNGEIQNIENTIFDFTNFKKIGTNINDDILKNRNGYDHCYIINANGLTEAAVVKSEKSGIILTCFTTKPAIQLYTANDLNSMDDQKDGCYYKRYGGLCLETQYPLNGINTGKAPILKANERYLHKTIYNISSMY